MRQAYCGGIRATPVEDSGDFGHCLLFETDARSSEKMRSRGGPHTAYFEWGPSRPSPMGDTPPCPLTPACPQTLLRISEGGSPPSFTRQETRHSHSLGDCGYFLGLLSSTTNWGASDNRNLFSHSSGGYERTCPLPLSWGKNGGRNRRHGGAQERKEGACWVLVLRGFICCPKAGL